jgi:hypothetical protein
LAACAAAPAAEARLTALTRAPYDPNGHQEFALAADSGLALFGKAGPHGSGRIVAVPLLGGRARVVQDLKVRRHHRLDVIAISAAGGQAGILADEYSAGDESDPVAISAYLGPVGGPFRRLKRAVYDGRHYVPIALMPSAGGYAFGQIRPKRLPFITTVTTPAGTRRLAPKEYPLAVAGDLMAYVVATKSSARLVVANLATGAIRYSTPLSDSPETLDLAPDGRAAFEDDGGVNVVDAGGRLSSVPSRRDIDLSNPHLAGGTLVAVRRGNGEGRERVVAVAAADGSVRPLGPLVDSVDSLDTDGPTAIWNAGGCVLAADAGAIGETTTPAGPCPRSLVFLESGQNTRLRGRSFRVRIACLTSDSPRCRGRVGMRILGHRTLGFTRFSIPVGANRTVRVRLTRREDRTARRQLAVEDIGDAVAETRDTDGRIFRAREGIGLYRPR